MSHTWHRCWRHTAELQQSGREFLGTWCGDIKFNPSWSFIYNKANFQILGQVFSLIKQFSPTSSVHLSLMSCVASSITVPLKLYSYPMEEMVGSLPCPKPEEKNWKVTDPCCVLSISVLAFSNPVIRDDSHRQSSTRQHFGAANSVAVLCLSVRPGSPCDDYLTVCFIWIILSLSQ